ncbi:MAG: hypothetical protein N3G79_07020 [Sulfolobales archaeon]|nr:hypothetical protein [Sulfolobales archaeon]
MLEKRNRRGGKEYRVFYIHLPRKLIDAIGYKSGDMLDVKVVVYEGKQALLLVK